MLYRYMVSEMLGTSVLQDAFSFVAKFLQNCFKKLRIFSAQLTLNESLQLQYVLQTQVIIINDYNNFIL